MPEIDLDAEDPFEALNAIKDQREKDKMGRGRPYVKSNTQKLICGLLPLGNNA